MQTKTAPIPTSYLEISLYLKDVYNFRKNLNKSFSYQMWADELNLKSRSSLRMVIQGEKPLTTALSQALASSLGLKDLEKEYFFLMTSQSLETDSDKKKELTRKMLDLLRYINGRAECSDAEEFLKDPGIPALQVLLSFDDVPRKIGELSQLLQKSSEEVLSWLKTLEDLGLARYDSESNDWRAVHSDFKISEKLGSQVLQNYHSSVLRESAQAVHLPAHLRRFRTVLLPLSEQQYSEFSQQLNDALMALLAKYASSRLDGKRLYRYTMALMPMTDVHLSSQEHETEKSPSIEVTV